MSPKSVEPVRIDLPASLPFAQYQTAAAIYEAISILQAKPEKLLIILPEGSVKIHPEAETVQHELPAAEFTAQQPSMLPFSDGEFGTVVAADVIDRFGEAGRAPFIKELTRVAKQYLVVLSPFESQVVSSAEESVNEVYRSTFGKSHPEIVLHRDIGLPNLRRLNDTVANLTGYIPEVFPVGSLRSWALLNMLSYVANGFERGDMIFSRLNQFYNERFAQVDHAQPAYRHMVVASTGNKPLKQTIIRQFSDRYRSAAHEAEIETVRGLMRLALDGYAEALAAPPPKGALTSAVRQIQELERKVRNQQRTIEKQNDEIFRLKNPNSPARLIKKLFTF
jgi:hypothetical protein